MPVKLSREPMVLILPKSSSTEMELVRDKFKVSAALRSIRSSRP